MENKNNIQNLSNKFRNFLPFTALFVLTAGLLFYFKENKQSVNEFIETGKDNLIGFYSQNLKPLLFKTDITNEDVFNFAIYQNLPIDKEENKVLQIGYNNTDGGKYYEVKPAQINENTHNYDKFVEYLNLNKEEHRELDSILNSYKDELYTSILYNEKNVFAVNSKVSLIRDAILAELMSFAQNKEINSNGKSISYNFKYNTPDIRKAINEIKETKEYDKNDFIIFTPDSILNYEFEIDENEFQNKMEEVHWNLAEAREKLKDLKLDIKINHIVDLSADKKTKKQLEIKIDSSNSKAFVSKNFMVKGMKDLVDVEKLTNNIEKLTSQIHQINFQANKNKLKIKMDHFSDSDSAFSFEFNLDGFEEMIQNSIKGIDEKSIKDWEEFGLKMDSVANTFEFRYKDSSINFDKKKIKEEMQKIKSEMKKNKNVK